MKQLWKLIKRSWRFGNKPSKARQKNEGVIRPTGRLIAHKPQRDLKIDVHEEISVREGYGIHREDAQEESVRIVDSEGQMVWTDLDSSGAIASTIEGKSRQGESGTYEVCSILLAKINYKGASWGNLIDLSTGELQREEGVDCRAFDGNDVLDIQVTRVERAIWKDLAIHGKAPKDSTVAEVAAEIWEAITQKTYAIPVHQRNKLVLALNALETPQYTLKQVIDEFRRKHGISTRSLGYLSVWVVGPTESLTYRLDMQQAISGSSN